MKTVLFTHPSAELYGADRTLIHAVRATQAAGRQAIVALPRRGQLAERLEAFGAKVVVRELGAALRKDLSPSRFASFLRKARSGARAVNELVEQHEVDLVHTNTSVLVGAAHGAGRAPVPHVWHVHEILDEPSWARRTMSTLLHRWSDIVLANSEATARAMTPRGAKNVRVLHNGFDAQRFQGKSFLDRAALEDVHGIPSEQRLVVAPGRINGWKGQRLLVEALGEARSALGHVHVAFIGDPPSGQEHFLAELESDIERLKLGGMVTIVPFTEELPSILRAADLCVVPSTKPEPFGLVALEAMASGTAVLAAGHGGLIEIVESGRTGELFIPGSARDLSERLVEMLASKSDLAQAGTNGRIRAETHFSLAAHEAGIVALHDELLGIDRVRQAA